MSQGPADAVWSASSAAWKRPCALADSQRFPHGGQRRSLQPSSSAPQPPALLQRQLIMHPCSCPVAAVTSDRNLIGSWREYILGFCQLLEAASIDWRIALPAPSTCITPASALSSPLPGSASLSPSYKNPCDHMDPRDSSG